MNNKGLIITLIILLVIVIILLIATLVLGIIFGNSYKIKLFSFGHRNTKVIYENTYSLEEVKNIDIIQNAGEIKVKESEDNNIHVELYGNDENDVDVRVSNNCLKIDYKIQTIRIFSFGATKNDIIIYVPSDYSEKIDIKCDCGDCEIVDLENASVKIDCDAGDVKVGKIKNANIDCKYGNINITEVLNKCDIKADCGNIEIGMVDIKEDSNIKADLGNVKIGNTGDIYIDADVDLGNKNINRNNRNAENVLKIKCDCGNITVST